MKNFKTYSAIHTTNGQIRLMPGIKSNIKAFVQLSHDEIRMGKYPSNNPFPVANMTNILHPYKTHHAFITKSKTLVDTDIPWEFVSMTKWEEWILLSWTFYEQFQDATLSLCRTFAGITKLPILRHTQISLTTTFWWHHYHVKPLQQIRMRKMHT